MDFSLNLTEHHTPTAKFDIIVVMLFFQVIDHTNPNFQLNNKYR